MIKHLPDTFRPLTEIERIIRDIEPKLPDQVQQPMQVPGFRNPNDPRIPTSLRQAALAATKRGQFQPKRTTRSKQ